MSLEGAWLVGLLENDSWSHYNAMDDVFRSHSRICHDVRPISIPDFKATIDQGGKLGSNRVDEDGVECTNTKLSPKILLNMREVSYQIWITSTLHTQYVHMTCGRQIAKTENDQITLLQMLGT